VLRVVDVRLNYVTIQRRTQSPLQPDLQMADAVVGRDGRLANARTAHAF
jgi:hypothetical protein